MLFLEDGLFGFKHQAVGWGHFGTLCRAVQLRSGTANLPHASISFPENASSNMSPQSVAARCLRMVLISDV